MERRKCKNGQDAASGPPARRRPEIPWHEEIAPLGHPIDKYPGGDVGQRCRELLPETARAHEIVVHAGSNNRDHVHMLLSIAPSLPVSRAVQYLKGRSSRQLLSEFVSLRNWGQNWWVRASGNVSVEGWAEYTSSKHRQSPVMTAT